MQMRLSAMSELLFKNYVAFFTVFKKVKVARTRLTSVGFRGQV